jgi:hypothetical protein
MCYMCINWLHIGNLNESRWCSSSVALMHLSSHSTYGNGSIQLSL